MNPEYVRLHVGIPREQLQTDAASVLIVRKGRGLEAGVLVVLLELVGLQHHLPFHHPAAGPAVVGRVQVLVVRGARQLLVPLLLLCRILLRLLLLLLLLASLLSLLVLLWPRLLLLLLVMSPTTAVVVMVDSVVLLLLSVGLAGDGLLGGLAAVHLLAGGGGEEGGAVAVHLNKHGSDIS